MTNARVPDEEGAATDTNETAAAAASASLAFDQMLARMKQEEEHGGGAQQEPPAQTGSPSPEGLDAPLSEQPPEGDATYLGLVGLYGYQMDWTDSARHRPPIEPADIPRCMLALCMAKHPVLGAASPARALTSDTIKMISDLLLGEATEVLEFGSVARTLCHGAREWTSEWESPYGSSVAAVAEICNLEWLQTRIDAGQCSRQEAVAALTRNFARAVGIGCLCHEQYGPRAVEIMREQLPRTARGEDLLIDKPQSMQVLADVVSSSFGSTPAMGYGVVPDIESSLEEDIMFTAAPVGEPDYTLGNSCDHDHISERRKVECGCGGLLTRWCEECAENGWVDLVKATSRPQSHSAWFKFRCGEGPVGGKDMFMSYVFAVAMNASSGMCYQRTLEGKDVLPTHIAFMYGEND